MFAWQGHAYWEFSDGVYAETAREVLHGTGLYAGVAGAQPPPVYLFGVLLLAIHDGVAALRVGLGLVNAITACLVGGCVWRLTRRASVAVIAALATPLLAISLHEHAQLIPETLAAPLILGGAWCCADQRRSTLGGVLLACACACKLAFVIPAVVVVAAASARPRAAVSFAVAGLVLTVVTVGVFGSRVWNEVVVAQTQVGTASLHSVAGAIAQAAWNDGPLVLLGLLAVTPASRSTDPRLRRTLAAAALGGLILALTLIKRGSAIDVMLIAEPALLALAAAGLVTGWERRWARPLIGVLVTLLVLQSGSELLSPGSPVIARRPFATSGLEYRMSASAVSRAVIRADRCSPRRAYSGDPYIAFLAGRRMPGAQPDVFIVSRAAIDGRFARRAAADRPVCP